MALHDVINILGGLGTSHVAAADYWIVVVSGVLKKKDITAHIAPTLGDGAVFFCQCHSIANVVGTTIIGGEGEADALGRIGDVEEKGLQFAHITGGGCYIRFWFVYLLARQ